MQKDAQSQIDRLRQELGDSEARINDLRSKMPLDINRPLFVTNPNVSDLNYHEIFLNSGNHMHTHLHTYVRASKHTRTADIMKFSRLTLLWLWC